jgi:2-dehydropantoate 2-reductase
MKVTIVGAGSIGAALGAKLAATGHEVSLVARGAHLDAIVTKGLKLVDHVDSFSQTFKLPASADPGAFGPQDLVIIGLKAHAIGPMLPKMAPLIGRDTVVVPAINGMPWWYFHRHGGPHDGLALRTLDPEGTMFKALDCRHIVGCVVHIAAEVRAPGEVHHTNGRRMILGDLDNTLSARLQRVGAALQACKLDTVLSTNIRLDVWTKLLGNLSFNPIAALTGYLMNQICADEGVLAPIRLMMREGMAVSEHYGIKVPMTPDQRIDLARQLGAAKISMMQDLEQRRPLELAAIVGAVIELAERANIPVPTIRMIHDLTLARAKTLGIA